MVTDYQK